MKLSIAHNSHLRPNTRKRGLQAGNADYPAEGEKLHTKQPQAPARMGRKGGIFTERAK